MNKTKLDAKIKDKQVRNLRRALRKNKYKRLWGKA